jgi:hypothetical protein
MSHLKDWVSFVKKVSKEEGLSYKEAMVRAKERKNKGEQWMSGSSKKNRRKGGDTPTEPPQTTLPPKQTTPSPQQTTSPEVKSGGKSSNRKSKRNMRKSKRGTQKRN